MYYTQRRKGRKHPIDGTFKDFILYLFKMVSIKVIKFVLLKSSFL